MFTFLPRLKSVRRRSGVAAVAALALSAVAAAGPSPTPAAASHTCNWLSDSQTTGSRLATIWMSNGSPNAVAVGGWASFRTCSTGSIYVNWAPSLVDNRGDLAFLGATMQFRTNRNRVITSTRQYVDGWHWELPIGTERSHYDVVGGEYPVQVKFIYYARKDSNAGRTIGTFNRTCSVHWNGAGTRRCSSGQGAGGW